MKKFLSAVLFIGTVFLLSACNGALDYSSPDNWIVCEKEKTDAVYDLFYLYPTLSNDEMQTTLNLNDRKVMEKVEDFAKAQTGIFSADARIFAPKVRQLEYHAINEYIHHPDEEKWKTRFMEGVHDAENAFHFYRKNIQDDRPFILLGHSQGAMELYELLKKDGSIDSENGFTAAYLIGLPKLTETQFRTDFKERRISPAQSADDLAVIVVWNTQSKNAENSMFSVANGLCINPLNWKTDGTPASAAENKGAFFYDYSEKSSKAVPQFCGAYVDREKGALIADLPENSQWDANGFMGKGVFHMNDIWFFAENLKENMLHRAKTYNAAKSKENKSFLMR